MYLYLIFNPGLFSMQGGPFTPLPYGFSGGYHSFLKLYILIIITFSGMHLSNYLQYFSISMSLSALLDVGFIKIKMPWQLVSPGFKTRGLNYTDLPSPICLCILQRKPATKTGFSLCIFALVWGFLCFNKSMNFCRGKLNLPWHYSF